MELEQTTKFFIPLDISKSGTINGQRYVRGYASTPDLDYQNEMIDQSGVNIDYFVKSGWVNYEHRQEAEYVIGYPTENCRVDSKGFFVEAVLLEDNKYADDIWELSQSLAKTGSHRRLGFSIEGAIRKRNSSDNRIIEDVVISNVAITKSPANPHATWESFVKSMTTGHEIDSPKQEGASALRKEDLARAITYLGMSLKFKDSEESDKMWREVSQYLDQSEKTSYENGIILLQMSKGISRKEAREFIDRRKES